MAAETRTEFDHARALALPEVCRLQHQGAGKLGWAPSLRAKFGYYTPDEWYEATLLCLVTATTRWLDVGCGRTLLANEHLARLLAKRCRLLVGLDPSENIYDNQLIHERVRCGLEDYGPEDRFDLVSLKMVAEHVSNPSQAVDALSRLTTPGGRVVVYTVAKWSPGSIVATMTPMSFHHFAKRILWGSEARDTFPTFYLMNTRKKLRSLFEGAGFVEESFSYLDDARALGVRKFLLKAELRLWKILKAIGLRYPEVCLLGIYRQPAVGRKDAAGNG